MLLDSLWGGTTEGWYWDNYDGASWFGSEFGWLRPSVDHLGHTILQSHFFFGAFGGHIGSVRADEFGASLYSSKGFFMDGFGLSVGVDLLNEQYSSGSGNYEHFSHASLLVRTPVPIPAAVWLFGSGLLGLIGFSKRTQVA